MLQQTESNDEMDAGRAESRGSCASSEISFINQNNTAENNLGSPRAPLRIESKTVMEDFKKDAIMINHKTKVSQVRIEININ
jgi:hypothetical protein